MSRTKRGADQLFGLVVLTCPNDNHKLGKVLLQPPGRFVLFGQGWLSANPMDEPLRLECRTCMEKGIRHDLRGSWDKVKALAAEVAEDPTRGKVSYMLGR